MSPTQKSLVWSFFVKAADNKSAMCHLCNQSFKYFASTSNLRKHVIRKHHIQLDGSLTNHKDVSENIIIKYEEPTESLGNEDIQDEQDDSTEGPNNIFFEDEGALDVQSNQSHTPLNSEELNISSQSIPTNRNFIITKEEPNCKRIKADLQHQKTEKLITLSEECEVFGKLVASHLKRLPRNTALECQADILNFLVQKRLGRDVSINTK
ncbi:hypothetical protein HHI36_019011 [Cryptolaemus montrouzieri]|uniref:BED-type domain-containing protein n=1 Tax=Cryptolaemus montrouzieri TaxID=559131 RepID=A0ABD2P2E3_9CUCU